jgi:alkylation response protein AidB-like acyl-CoA dehydrogenase
VSQKLTSGDMSELAEMHTILSAMKSQVTASAIEAIETARRSMGGHGFLAAAGVGRIYADNLPSATFVAFLQFGPNILTCSLDMRVTTTCWTSRLSGLLPKLTLNSN